MNSGKKEISACAPNTEIFIYIKLFSLTCQKPEPGNVWERAPERTH